MKSNNFKTYILRKINDSNSNKVYVKKDAVLNTGPKANWTSQRSEALRFNDLKWAFTVAKLYGCKVFSIMNYEIDSKGTKRYYVNGKLHRKGGPAVKDVDGYKAWYLNGKLHRIGGPAIEYANGNKEWWINFKLHREDGPAVECANGDKSWYLNGVQINVKSNEEFLELIKSIKWMMIAVR